MNQEANPYGTPQSNSTPSSSAYPAEYPRPTNGMAVAGLVMGILSVTIGCLFCPPLFSIPGLVFSMIGRNQIKSSGEEGRGMAITGIVLSAISLGLVILGLLVYVILIAAGMLSDEYTPNF